MSEKQQISGIMHYESKLHEFFLVPNGVTSLTYSSTRLIRDASSKPCDRVVFVLALRVHVLTSRLPDQLPG
jgi:hypothetical protein